MLEMSLSRHFLSASIPRSLRHVCTTLHDNGDFIQFTEKDWGQNYLKPNVLKEAQKNVDDDAVIMTYRRGAEAHGAETPHPVDFRGTHPESFPQTSGYGLFIHWELKGFSTRYTDLNINNSPSLLHNKNRSTHMFLFCFVLPALEVTRAALLSILNLYGNLTNWGNDLLIILCCLSS